MVTANWYDRRQLVRSYTASQSGFSKLQWTHKGLPLEMTDLPNPYIYVPGKCLKRNNDINQEQYLSDWCGLNTSLIFPYG